jgi:phosphopantetheine adenylyltransferase
LGYFESVELVVLVSSERIRKKEMLTQKIEETDKRIKTLEEHFLDSKISLEVFRSMKDSLLEEFYPI